MTTRERIVTEARRLFAAQGYRGTSVGDIEAAAGLSPRSGALYKHFASKEDVLRAVMAQHSDAVAEMTRRIELGRLGDRRAELVLMGRWGLAELRREHELTRIVMKEGERFPELARAFREAIVETAHAAFADWVAAQTPGVADSSAVAALFVDAMVGYTLQEALFGPGVSGGVDDERFLAAWVDATLATIESLTEERSPAHA